MNVTGNEFPRSRRLLKPAEFKRVLGRGRRCRCKLFSLAQIGAPGPHARLGLTVAKKSIPRAVERNRFKRVCREVFRNTHSLPAVDIVIMASPKARSIDSRQLAQELSITFEQLWPASSSS